MVLALPSGRAVVTGASSGIGAVYADRLAGQGLPLLLVARRAERLDALARELEQKHGVFVETLPADLTRPDELASLEARLEREDIAALINNAGVGGLGPTAGATADQMEAVVRLDIVALMRLSHAALAGFRRRNRGLLVNIGSIIAHAPSAGGAVYAGSKSFVMNLTRSLQAEYADSPIRIQLVMPGPIRTEFFSSQGMSDSVFPDSAYLSAAQLVDAALAGLIAGEAITTPAMLDSESWADLEAARQKYLAANMSGQVAQRYLAS